MIINLIFKNMLVTVSWISKKYDEFNKLYWENKLPKNLVFKTNRSRTSWGFASYRYDYSNDTIIPESIVISNYYDSPEYVKIQTLLHEMIHIADYTFNPHHFLKNGRRISKRTYDPHGWWFNQEAKRISNISDFTITNHVTREEAKASSLSENSRRLISNKQNNALICVVYGTNCNFYFKTDVNKVKNLHKTIKSYRFYRIGEIRKIKYYTFENERLANLRSCGTRLCGWFLSNKDMLTQLENIKATEVK